MKKMDIMSFYNGKRVLITGHTGFKGTWLTRILLNAGALVTGYALKTLDDKNLYDISGVKNFRNFNSVIGDIRDLEYLRSVFNEVAPEIVFHLAAQPIVLESYRNPVETYSTNVMGTVNILECVRLYQNTKYPVRSFLNITTDKVYSNNEWYWGYREEDPLNGYDPYSNSKSCSELITSSYRQSFFNSNDKKNIDVSISTARAGNVIGGGDFAANRIIPDCIRALEKAQDRGEREARIIVRNPASIRPYQHVLEPLMVYLDIAMAQYEDSKFGSCYNIGPDDFDCITTGKLVDLFCTSWNKRCACEEGELHLCRNDNEFLEEKAFIENRNEFYVPHEASFLKLDCSKLKSVFGWSARWHIEEGIDKTVEFYKVWLKCRKSGNYDQIALEMDREIDEFRSGK